MNKKWLINSGLVNIIKKKTVFVDRFSKTCKLAAGEELHGQRISLTVKRLLLCITEVINQRYAAKIKKLYTVSTALIGQEAMVVQ